MSSNRTRTRRPKWKDRFGHHHHSSAEQDRAAMHYTHNFNILSSVGGALGKVRAVRLDNPASETAIIYHGGNGSFVDSQGTSRTAASLASLTGADIILYDYVVAGRAPDRARKDYSNP